MKKAIKNILTGRTTGYNSTDKKLAVQWLNEALCFVSSSVHLIPPEADATTFMRSPLVAMRN